MSKTHELAWFSRSKDVPNPIASEEVVRLLKQNPVAHMVIVQIARLTDAHHGLRLEDIVANTAAGVRTPTTRVITSRTDSMIISLTVTYRGNIRQLHVYGKLQGPTSFDKKQYGLVVQYAEPQTPPVAHIVGSYAMPQITTREKVPLKREPAGNYFASQQAPGLDISRLGVNATKDSLTTILRPINVAPVLGSRRNSSSFFLPAALPGQKS